MEWFLSEQMGLKCKPKIPSADARRWGCCNHTVCEGLVRGKDISTALHSTLPATGCRSNPMTARHARGADGIQNIELSYNSQSRERVLGALSDM